MEFFIKHSASIQAVFPTARWGISPIDALFCFSNRSVVALDAHEGKRIPDALLQVVITLSQSQIYCQAKGIIFHADWFTGNQKKREALASPLSYPGAFDQCPVSVTTGAAVRVEHDRPSVPVPQPGNTA